MRLLPSVLCLTVLLSALAVSAGQAASLILYVSPQGHNDAPGTRAHPLATLTGARDRIRSLRAAGQLPAQGVTVWLRGGVYQLHQPFSLTAADDTSPVPVTYRNFGKEAVTLEGGQTVAGWMPVTDPAILARLAPAARGHVLQADFKAQGITDYGDLSPRGFGRPVTPAGMELFFHHTPMTLARWPNPGQWATIAGTAADQGSNHFSYSSDEPSRWVHDDDVWVHGYWGFDWADDYEQVQSIDVVHHTIQTMAPHSAFGYAPGHRWYALNILEELDQPGEWYLDRKRGLLYFWPPSDIHKGQPTVSLATALVQMNHVNHVTLRGLTLEDCRGTAVTITNGDQDILTHCIIQNSGNDAVSLEHDTRTGVSHCDITQSGDGGVFLSGGNRQTLAPGGDFVTDCRIWHYSRWDFTYYPGVSVNGVGNRVAHNLIYDAPHMAIFLSGNDNIVEYNEVHHVCQETGDAGAFYMGRDWTMRGNIVRFNEFHDLGGGTGLLGDTDVNAIYLDDMACGTLVYGNLCIRAGRGVLVGGGRDNTVENNVFEECKEGILLDARGLSWAAKSILPGGDWQMQQKLAAVPYNQPPYSTLYPHLANILQDDPGAPKYNLFQDNVAVDCPTFLNIEPAARPGVVLTHNLAEPGPKLTRTPPGFHRLPLSQIGPTGGTN